MSEASLSAERQRVARHAAARRRTGRVTAVSVSVILVAGAVVGALAGLVTSWMIGIAVAAVVALAGWFGVVGPRLATAEARLLRLVGPTREADPRSEARLLNLVDGLVPSAGVARPRCLVLDSPGPNAVAFGRDARHGCFIVTTGLLDNLDRMQLEGVVARALVTIRDGVTAGTTRALAIGGSRLRSLGGDPGSPADLDLAAVTLTRYPPGLASALRRVLDAGPPVAAPDSSPLLDKLWLAPPGDGDGVSTRAQALEEL